MASVFLDAGNTILELNYPVIARALGAEPDAVRRAEWAARGKLDTPELTRRLDDESRWHAYFSLVAQGCGKTDRRDIAKAIRELEVYDAAGDLWDMPAPGVHEALAALRSRHRLGVISNSFKPVPPLLERLGLAAFFETITDSVTAGVEKPDPRIFHAACRSMGVEPAAAVYVGDLYHVDVLGARAAGMEGILIDPTGERRVDCRTARTLAGLVAILDGR